MTKQRVRFIVGLLLSLTLFGWVVARTDWRLVLDRLQGANGWLLAAALCFVVLSNVLRSWRWKIMLEQGEREVPFTPLFDAVNLGYLANNLLPARLGDLLRAYLAGEWTSLSVSFALSATVVERILDTVVVVLLLFTMLPFLPVPPLVARTGVVAGIGVVLFSFLLIGAVWQRERSERVARVLLRPLPLDETLWSRRLMELLEGFRLVEQPLRFLRVLAVSALVWGMAIGAYWLTFLAFDLPQLGALGATFTISLAALGMAAPSGPAAAGTYDAAVAGALGILGIGVGLAGGVAVVLHAVNFLAIVLLGVFTMARRGLSLGFLRRRAAQVETLQVSSMEPQ